MTLTKAITSRLEGEVEMVSAYQNDISACIDCRYCQRHAGCAIKDGMQSVYARIDAADQFIIASPLYFSQLTGPLLSVMSRLQTYYAARRFRGEPKKPAEKPGVLILTGGGDGPKDPAIATADMLFSLMGARRARLIHSLLTDERPAAQDAEALAAAVEAAMFLNG